MVRRESTREFMTVVDVAKMTGLSRNTIYNLIRQNDIPNTKLGTIILIPRKPLMELFGMGVE